MNEGMIIIVISRKIHLMTITVKDIIRRGLMKETRMQQQQSNPVRVDSNTNVILSALRKFGNGICVGF